MSFNLFFIGKILAIGLISLVPICLWLYIINRYYPEKKKYSILTFFAGMFSVIPIKFYQNYWDSTFLFFQNLNLIQHLNIVAQSSTIVDFLLFISLSLVVSMGIFLFIALLSLIVDIFFEKNPQQSITKKLIRISESPFIFLSVGTIIACIAFSTKGDVNEKIWFFAIVGILEEYTKHLFVRFSDELHIKNLMDAVEFSIIVALGFAFVENIIYAYRAENNPIITYDILFVIIFLRSTVSVLAHVTFSAIFGYFYGLARFAHQQYQNIYTENRGIFLRFILQTMHGKSNILFHEEQMIIGLAFSTIMHFAFNVFLEFGKIVFVVGLSAIMLVLLLAILHHSKYHVSTINNPHLINE